MPGMIQVDCRDVSWRRSMGKLSRAYKRAKTGDIIELLTTDCATEEAARTWCKRTGNREMKVECDTGGVFVMVIQISPKKTGESITGTLGKSNGLVKTVTKGVAK